MCELQTQGIGRDIKSDLMPNNSNNLELDLHLIWSDVSDLK